MLFHFKYWIWS